MKWYQSKWGKFLIIISGVIFVLLLAILDGLIYYGYDLSLLYIVPVVIAAFFIGRWTAVYTALFSAVAWLIADLTSQVKIDPTTHLSNTLIRIGFFVFVTQGIYYLAKIRERQAELIEFIVHDLKTPLTNISVALSSIMEKVSDTPNKIHHFAKLALVSSKKMVTFINALIDLSKIEESKYVSNLTQVNLREMVNSAVETVKLWAEKANITIEEDIDTKTNIVNTDPNLVERTLMNLLSNALKVSPAGSKISVRVEEGLNKLIFCVTDQGPGFSKKWKNRTFDRQFQMEAKKDGMIAGSGIGLTFCQFAIKQLGGHIWFDSEPGQGTSVTFELPVKN